MMNDAPPVDLGPQVAEEVRVWLARRRLSATELARRIGVTQSYLARRMSGAQPFDITDLGRIAHALDVLVGDLLPASSRSTSAGATGRYPTVDPLAARVVAVGGEARPTRAVRTRRSPHPPARAGGQVTGPRSRTRVAG